MGGGVLLITLMPGLVPASAILPVHALTQLASNSSRALFGWRCIDWTLIPALGLGAVLGAWLGAEFYSGLNLRWLPVLMGVVILIMTWLPLPKPRGDGQFALLFLGFYQTGLGMLAGATGPLGAAVLRRYNHERDWLVVNTAVYMSLNHCLRVAAFALLGFSFMPWLHLIIAMAIAVILGSWVGTRLRWLLPEANFQRWFRWLLSVLALRMVVLPFIYPN